MNPDTDIFNPASVTLALFFFVGVAVLYLLPTLIAFKRSARNANWAAAINILLGVTVIGWLIALIMALGSRSATRDAHRLGRDDQATQRTTARVEPAPAVPRANSSGQDWVPFSDMEPRTTQATADRPAHSRIAPITNATSSPQGIADAPSTPTLPDGGSTQGDARLAWLADKGEAARQGIKELRARSAVQPLAVSDVTKLALLNRVYQLTVQIYSLRSRSGGATQAPQLASLESELALYLGAPNTTQAQTAVRSEPAAPIDAQTRAHEHRG